jgi:hypothetical protein
MFIKVLMMWEDEKEKDRNAMKPQKRLLRRNCISFAKSQKRTKQDPIAMACEFDTRAMKTIAERMKTKQVDFIFKCLEGRSRR